ncbi:MAG: 50S ribosomal protein L23 [Bacillota bacterium]|nr:MAG: 50S ribosomal protein L23 [Bacillota bacterium]
MTAHDIIIKPVLTEKSYGGIQDKKYTFVVAKSANKTEIKKAVEEVFGVQVEKVNTANVRGKMKRMGKNQGYTPAYKKAVVQLRKDSKSIEFFDSLS